MKKLSITLLVIILASCQPVSADLFGGGISGPLPVYSVNPGVDAATLATQINTFQQLDAALKNLASMDSATAYENQALIADTITQLINLQNSMNLQMSQAAYEGKYMDVSQMTVEEQIQYIQGLQAAQGATLQSAMEAQGMIVQRNAGMSYAIQQLLASSQSAEGAKAAAQIGHQLAALQLTQLMQTQEMIARGQRAELERQAYEREKEKAAEKEAQEFFKEPSKPQKGQGPGVSGFNK
jgi:P-type conjugative transfer protein TrbJ